MKYLLNCRSFIFLMVLFSFFDNFGMYTVEDYVYRFKVIFVGDVTVGKTQIINKFMNDKFDANYQQTFGANLAIKVVNFKDKKIKLELWEIFGQKAYKNIMKDYYKGSHLIVFVYAVDDKNSFDNIQQIWVNEVRSINKDAKFLLVGNKCDLEDKRQVSTEEAMEYAEKNNMEFIEVSAKDKINIEKMFDNSLKNFLDDMEKEKNNNLTNNNTHNFEQKNLLLDYQNKDSIKIEKTSCWSKYCSCCPCLKKSEENVEEQE